MAKKTWKIGEYCRGGIITVETKQTSRTATVAIIGKEWDHSAGDTKSSDQSKAKEFTRSEYTLSKDGFGYGNREKYNNMDMFLNDLTSSYYADQVLSWIKETVKIN